MQGQQDFKVTAKTLFIFGMVQFFYMLMMNMVTAQINYYATDLLFIPVALVGTITISGKVIETISAPLLGVMIEKVRLPWGKYRSWIFIACIPFAIFHMLIFVLADIQLSLPASIAAFAAFLFLGSLAGNVVQSVHSSLVQGITYVERDRKKLIKVNMTGNYLAKAATGFVTLQIIAFFAVRTGNEARGFTVVLLGVALLGICGYFILGHTVKRFKIDDHGSNERDFTVREMLKLTFSNKPLLCAFGAFFLKSGAYFTVIGTASYYFKHVSGAPGMMPTFMSVINIVSLGAVLLSQFFFRWFTNKQGYMIALILMAASCIVARFAGSNHWIFIISMCFFAFGDSMVGIYAYVLFAEAVDFCEYKNGDSFRGLSMCLLTLALDGSRILQQIVIAVGLSAIGYSAAQGISVEQAPTLMNMICIAPLLFLVIGGIILKSYSLDAKTMKDVRQKLADRRNGIATAK